MTLDNTITAVFTATKGRTASKRHAMADSKTVITVCGLDTTTGFYLGGHHHTPQEITCGNCLRILRLKPMITLEITAEILSAYRPDDHSGCEHFEDETDSDCDAVGGRSLDGDTRTISEESITVEFDPEAWAEAVYAWGVDGQAQIISAYLRAVLDGPLNDYGYQTWAFDHYPVEFYGPGQTLRAVEEGSAETFADYTLRITGPGVTDSLRRVAFETLVSC